MKQRLNSLTPEWRERVASAVDFLEERNFTASVGLILGSGLGNFVDALENPQAIDYSEIPGFTTTSVAEHKGRLVAGDAAGLRVLVMQGRLHPYEGLPFTELLLPTAVLACLGLDSVVVTNAAGGLNAYYLPGDLMVIRDHLDMHFCDPLQGLLMGDQSIERAGKPAALYDPDLARLLQDAGAATGVPVHAGVYGSMWGPTYETKAEIGMLRRAGCDTVGMSTAPEVALLNRMGVKVVGLSCVTNPAREVGQPELSHNDVVETGIMVRDRVASLLLEFLPRLDKHND
jgi:purine-nucleoside phosphorylase